MRRFALLGTVAAVLALGGIGCGDDAGSLPPGNLSIHWLIGASGCEQTGVTEVAVFVSTSRGEQVDLQSFACTAETAVLTGLQPGVYNLSLRGRDAQGVDRFGAELPEVEVRSNGTTTTQTIHLNALPAELRLSWYFDNGRMCAYNGVSAVDIVLFEDEYAIYSTSADCTFGEVELIDIQADTYIVDVQGVDENGRSRFSGQDEIEVGRGERARVEVRLMNLDPNRPSPTEEEQASQ